MKIRRRPVLTERRTDDFGEYELRWMVKPPPKGAKFRVVEESWSCGYKVRKIYRFELCQ